MSLDTSKHTHPAVLDLAQWFSYDHLTDESAKTVSASFAATAQDLLDRLPDSAELSAALRKLLEAKDCGVRAALAVSNAAKAAPATDANAS